MSIKRRLKQIEERAPHNAPQMYDYILLSTLSTEAGATSEPMVALPCGHHSCEQISRQQNETAATFLARAEAKFGAVNEH